MASNQITVSESIVTYLAVKSAKSAEYRRDLEMTLRGFRNLVGDIQMRHLNEEHVAAAFNIWASKHMASTFNKKLDCVRQWLVFASRRKHMRTAPGDLLGSVERRRVMPRKRVYLDAHGLLGILEATKHPRDRMYLALAMNTALRASEIISLKVEDVDLDMGNLYVIRHKTSTRDVLPITTDLDRELRRWLKFYTEQVGVLHPHFLLVPAKTRPDTQGYRSVDQMSGVLVPERQMQRNHQLMQRLLAAAGHPIEREGLHTIRRSVARTSYEWFLEQGETRDEALSVVQATLGHSTQSVTERYIGVERSREKRDRVMRGQPFLTAMIADTSNVRRLDEAGSAMRAVRASEHG